MGRDYVTVREEEHDGKRTVAETSVGRMLLKSAPAKVVQQDGRFGSTAWLGVRSRSRPSRSGSTMGLDEGEP